MLTDEQLNRIKVLIDWATPEPLQRNLYDHGGGRMFRELSPERTRTLVIDAFNQADRNFYFEALPNMQALVDEVERLCAELAAHKDALSHYMHCLTPDEFNDAWHRAARLLEPESYRQAASAEKAGEG